MFVAKGSPQGYDVHDAIDYLLSFSSEFPLLKVHETGTSTGTVNHDLGYYPFFLTTNSTFIPGSVDQVSYSEWGVSTSQLVRSSGATNTRYFIFRLNLETNFTADIFPGITSKTPEESSFVFKISKDGKDISSTDLRDFSLHSNTKSPMVHKVDNGTMTSSGDWTRTISHGLSYTPVVFAFIRVGNNAFGLAQNRYYVVPPQIGITPFDYTVTATSVTVRASGPDFSDAPQVSIVVLKDPFSKQTVDVSFP